MKRSSNAAMAATLVAFAAPAAAAGDRILRAEITVMAPVDAVWSAWTTDEGIVSFFARGGHVDLRIDGTYDIWFNPAGAPGERGADGMRILDIEPEKRFVFTWNAPPSIPAIRPKRTLVVVEFAPEGETATRVRFTHLGWGEGPEWDKAYDYFDRAWGAVVLPRLQHRFTAGPIDWNAPPELDPIAATIKQTLVRDTR